MKYWTLLCGKYVCYRITKQKAELAYRNGLRVILCGARVTDSHPLSYCSCVDRSSGRTFQDVVEQFVQEKKRASYFIPCRYVSRFSGEPVDSNHEEAILEYDYEFINEPSFYAASHHF